MSSAMSPAALLLIQRQHALLTGKPTSWHADALHVPLAGRYALAARYALHKALVPRPLWWHPQRVALALMDSSAYAPATGPVPSHLLTLRRLRAADRARRFNEGRTPQHRQRLRRRQRVRRQLTPQL